MDHKMHPWSSRCRQHHLGLLRPVGVFSDPSTFLSGVLFFPVHLRSVEYICFNLYVLRIVFQSTRASTCFILFIIVFPSLLRWITSTRPTRSSRNCQTRPRLARWPTEWSRPKIAQSDRGASGFVIMSSVNIGRDAVLGIRTHDECTSKGPSSVLQNRCIDSARSLDVQHQVRDLSLCLNVFANCMPIFVSLLLHRIINLFLTLPCD